MVMFIGLVFEELGQNDVVLRQVRDRASHADFNDCLKSTVQLLVFGSHYSNGTVVLDPSSGVYDHCEHMLNPSLLRQKLD